MIFALLALGLVIYGYVSTFKRAGFEIVARHVPPRPGNTREGCICDHYFWLIRNKCSQMVDFQLVHRMFLVVRNIMVSNVITTEKDTLVINAVKIMNQHGIGCLVVMENGSPAGIVTERDLLKRVLAESKNPRKIRVQEVMSSPLIVGQPDMEIEEVTKFMFGRKIKKLPIVEDGKLVGLVTMTDLLSFQPSLIRVVKELTHPHSWKKVEA